MVTEYVFGLHHNRLTWLF